MNNIEIENKSLVILDCDPGIDDMWAIFLLLQGEPHLNYKVLGITCCSGNTHVNHATQNALLALKTLERLDVSFSSTNNLILK